MGVDWSCIRTRRPLGPSAGSIGRRNGPDRGATASVSATRDGSRKHPLRPRPTPLRCSPACRLDDCRQQGTVSPSSSTAHRGVLPARGERSHRGRRWPHPWASPVAPTSVARCARYSACSTRTRPVSGVWSRRFVPKADQRGAGGRERDVTSGPVAVRERRQEHGHIRELRSDAIASTARTPVRCRELPRATGASRGRLPTAAYTQARSGTGG